MTENQIKELIKNYIRNNLTLRGGSVNDFYSSGFEVELILSSEDGDGNFREESLGSASITLERD